MFNVQTDLGRRFPSLAALALIAILSGCGPSAEEKAREERRNIGEALSSEIENAVQSKDYRRVLLLCDSLDKTCPDQKELRKKAMTAWTEARHGILVDSAQLLDSQIDSLTNRMTVLMPDFVKVQISSAFDGYRVPKAISGGTPLVARTGIEPRLGDQDDLWTLVVNVAGSKPSIHGLRLTVPNGGSVEAIADNASERRATETAGEMLSFKAEEVEPIADALSNCPDLSGAKFEIIGSSRTIPLNLTKQLADAIVETRQMAKLREERISLLKKRELISRKIQLADSQRKGIESK